MDKPNVVGAGVGFRREFAEALCERHDEVDFIEVTPENFAGRGGHFVAMLDRIAEHLPILAHGVSSNLAGRDPFDSEHVGLLKSFLDRYKIPTFSDHLCFCAADGFVSYDLIPVPHNEANARYIAGRIRELSERLERPVYVENISAYARMPGSDMDEGQFTRAVCEEADCGLLLDVNNVYVNASNHKLDAETLLRSLPLDRVLQMHVAGHTERAVLKIDTHGAPVCDEVWTLLKCALTLTGPMPVLLERDTNIPALDEVLAEAKQTRAVFDSVFPELASDTSAPRGAAIGGRA